MYNNNFNMGNRSSDYNKKINAKIEEFKKMKEIQFGYLFYSNECKTCPELIKMMHNYNLLNMFKCKNIDEMTIDDIEKCGLVIVPTLIFVNMDKKLYELCELNKQIYEGAEAFAIVKKLINNNTVIQKFINDNVNLKNDCDEKIS